MVYVRRDEEQNIIEVSNELSDECNEEIDINSPELEAFLRQESVEAQQAIAELDQSDKVMGRVVEDLIELLITKNIITFTELPEATQRKILQRKRLRDILGQII